MKLTIIVEDLAAYKNKKSWLGLDMSNVPSNIRALQFDDITNKGHIEFNNSVNEEITILPSWAISIFNQYDNAVLLYEEEQAIKIAQSKQLGVA